MKLASFSDYVVIKISDFIAAHPSSILCHRLSFCVIKMLQVHLGDTPNNLTERDYEDLARKADGFSGSDVAVCVSSYSSPNSVSDIFRC